MEAYLQRYGFVFFLGFLALVIWAFWSSFYVNPFQEESRTLQAHGLAMTAWCGILVVQGFLIRTDRRRLHRWLGWAAIGLIVVNTLLQVVAVRKLATSIDYLWVFGSLSDYAFVFLAQALLGALVFLLFCALAIFYRKSPARHGGFMLCTVFPLLPPVIDRIINVYFSGFGSQLPILAGLPHVSVVAWVVADVSLVVLSVLHWRIARSLTVFPVALAVLLAYQLFTANAHRIIRWQIFCDWFLGL